MGKGGWYGEPGRHAQAARGIRTAWHKTVPSNPDESGDVPWNLANRKMRTLRTWLGKHMEPWSDWEVKDQEYFARRLEDIMMHLKNSRLERPEGFDTDIKETEEFLDNVWGYKDWNRTKMLELYREVLHRVMYEMAPNTQQFRSYHGY